MKREVRDLFYSITTKKDYLEKKEGYTNLLISAPHGGGIKPFNIPRRSTGQRLMDTYTRRISTALYNSFYPSAKPYALISDIHRSRVDLNRSLRKCSDGNRKAESIWKSWDFMMQTYQDGIRMRYDNGLYVDIHSHNDGDYFELGYNLSADDYMELHDTRKVKAESTLDTLGHDPYDMIFGRHSIKTSLESFGYRTLMPRHGEKYFNGGRNIEVYSGNGIGAIQIECPVSFLRTKYARDKVVYAIFFAIQRFRYTFVPIIFD